MWAILSVNNGTQYLNSNPDSTIQKIHLSLSQNGDRVIYVTASSPEHRRELDTMIRNARLPANNIMIGISPEMPHRLQSANISILANFMKIVKPLSVNFEEIEPDISQMLGIDLHQEYVMPISERRRVVIPAGRANPSPAIGHLLGQIGAPHIPVGRVNPSPAIGHILGQMGVFPQPQPVFPQDLTTGNNDALLAAINFSGEIPLEYTCPLSLAIMTDPVFDRDDPTETRFERSWIIETLRRNPIHPLTREPFVPASLLSDVQLKDEIDNFVQTTVNNNPTPTQTL